MSDFVQGVLIGGGGGVIVGVLAMAASVAAAKREESREQAQRFMYWADEREFNDRAVAANRRQAATSNPHGLQVVRDEFDQQQIIEGGSTW